MKVFDKANHLTEIIKHMNQCLQLHPPTSSFIILIWDVFQLVLKEERASVAYCPKNIINLILTKTDVR